MSSSPKIEVVTSVGRRNVWSIVPAVRLKPISHSPLLPSDYTAQGIPDAFEVSRLRFIEQQRRQSRTTPDPAQVENDDLLRYAQVGPRSHRSDRSLLQNKRSMRCILLQTRGAAAALRTAAPRVC